MTSRTKRHSNSSNRLTKSAQEYVDWHRELMSAIRTHDVAVVRNATSRMRTELERIENECSGESDVGILPSAVAAGRPIGFAVSTPIAAQCFRAIESLATSTSNYALFEHDRSGRRRLRKPIVDELETYDDPWDRLQILEGRLLALSDEGVEIAFEKLPELLRPVEELLAFYSEWNPRAESQARGVEHAVITPRKFMQMATAEGAMKINRFIEVVSRLYVQHPEAHDRGVRELVEQSDFLKAIASQEPNVVMSAQRVLMGCEPNCYSTDMDKAFTSEHWQPFADAFAAMSEELGAPAMQRFRKYHYKFGYYSSAMWDIAVDESGRVQPVPSIDLTTAIDPQSGCEIGWSWIRPGQPVTETAYANSNDLGWSHVDDESVIGCAAIFGNTVSSQIALHLDAHDDDAVSGYLIDQYRAMNAGKPFRRIATRALPSYPFSRYLSASTD